MIIDELQNLKYTYYIEQTCKYCKQTLPIGEFYKVVLFEQFTPKADAYYVCKPCYEEGKDDNENL